jgi:hypothetical protein
MNVVPSPLGKVDRAKRETDEVPFLPQHRFSSGEAVAPKA